MLYSPEFSDREGKVRRDQLLVAGARISAWPRLWDKFVDGVLPIGLLEKRLHRAAKELVLDDWSVERDGGARGLNAAEVELAVEKRGLDVTGRSETELRMLLQQCIDDNKSRWSEEMKNWLRLERMGQSYRE